MYAKETIGLEEATRAAQAIMDHVKKEKLLPVAIAVVDNHGDLIYYARMDRVSLNAAHMAMNKAYTAAKIRRDTSTLKKVWQEQNATIADLGDPRLTSMPAGVCITGGSMALRPCVGAIGVGGLPRGEDDEVLARIGVEAISRK